MFRSWGDGRLDFTFHELDDEPKDVPLTEYSKLGSPIERLLYNGLVMKGYYLQT
ncbi:MULTISPECIES: hypothetical protein [Peribacillus]|uniref:hypothetical protein n=1 Tax=Peribacillus TaxID=2675229 RepID=UPI001F4D4FBB|nr:MULTISPECIES: hypothetical protein [unclassified Peribacillus]MCK1982610.1 hypothetical protein [Peribacillus sp. Aquil_B1]MCK2008119.1 hypothetical protein [Peribacillus sp. Aquil_B8]